MAITKIEVPELFDFGSDNSAFKLPTGTTAERPTSPSNGEMRFNTTTGYVEYYDTTDTQWWEIDYEALCTTNDPNYPITNLAYYKMSDASDSGEGSGYIGQGGIFNGSSSYISIPTLGGSFYDSDFSISLWVNLNSLGGASTAYLFSGAGSRDIFINFNTGNSGGGISARLYDGTVRDVVYSSAVVGNWYHVVFVRSKTSGLNLYVDGVSRDTNTFTGNAQSISFISDGIGGRVQDRNTTDGKIDQVRIFPTALSSSNVSLLYAETSATSSTLNYPVTATALYEFSGNANSTSSSAYNGTATNVEYAYNGTATNVNFNVAGKFGNAGEFNGSNAYVTTPYTISGNPQSFSFWIKAASGGTRRVICGDFSSSGTNGRILIELNGSNEIMIYIGNSSGTLWSGWTPQSFTSYLNSWTNLIVTVSGTEVKLYLNGTLISTQTSGQTMAAGANGLMIGGYGQTVLLWNGSIDQIRIFDSVLNASQVTQLYNEIQCVPTIVPSESFNTVLYTGNGGTKAITDVGFQPDFTWIKSRNAAGSHIATDSVRGNGKEIYPDLTNAQGTVNRISLTSTGFDVVSAGYPNQTSNTFVAWNWKAGGTAVSNTDGTNITSQVSANTAAGFSVVEWTGDANSSSTIGHGLTPNSQPMLVIMKDLDSSNDWMVITNNLWSNPTAYFLKLNLTNALATGTGNPYLVNNTVFQNTNRNVSGNDYIAYAFHSVDGFSKMGSYVGGGATNVTVNVGFAPSFIMIKSTSAGRNWLIYDNVRETGTVPYENDTVLFPDSSSAEVTGNTIRGIQFTSTGFVLNQNYGNTNGSGETHIFLAIAADPT